MRRPDWPVHLDALIRAMSGRRFAYGSFDCCLFAADAVLAITGTDPAAGMRDYTGRRAALEILKREGGLVRLVSRLLSTDPIPAARAQRGDIVYCVRSDVASERGSLGVCIGINAAFVASTGLAFHPRTVADCGWHV